MTKDYDGEEINDINEDIMESLNKISEENLEQGIITGSIRIQVIHRTADDCDCVGFGHDRDCPHWVMCL